jgi:hypothetical protein
MDFAQLLATVPDIGDKQAREMTIARMADAMGAAREREKWRKVLAESCAEERSQLFEAGPGGGCDRALTAEAECHKLRAVMTEAADRMDGIKGCSVSSTIAMLREAAA